MKTRFILLVALFALYSTTVSAQFYNRKKVAITEIVDRAGDVSIGTKTTIRATLTDAITHSEGYEGYDTISFNSLEANFDITGHISPATLSYVKNQGMDYILWVEITPQDRETVIVTASIINTSTRLIVASSHVTTYSEIGHLRSACKALAFKLVGAL